MGKAKNAAIVLGAAGALTVVGLALWKLTRPPKLGAKFSGFKLEKIEPGTTTRQSTGEIAKDFQFYPLINVIPDVNGDYTVTWSWTNKFPTETTQAGYSCNPEGTTLCITNVFTGLKGGTPVQLQLIDNRDPATTGRDPTRNGAIAIGDKDFIAYNVQDGLYHSFKSDVRVKVTSPSGASVNLSGTLGPENFKSVGVLSAAFAGFALTKIT